jgi:hypothetical protein
MHVPCNVIIIDVLCPHCRYYIGTELHGKSGINPDVSFKIYTTFCRPSVSYGLEALTLAKGDEQELLSFERRLLKQIQGLTDRCPTIAVCSLLGAIPITTQIEKNTFTTFCNALFL